MSAAAVIAEALSAGVQVRLDDGVVKVKGAPSPELLAKLREQKLQQQSYLQAVYETVATERVPRRVVDTPRSIPRPLGRKWRSKHGQQGPEAVT